MIRDVDPAALDSDRTWRALEATLRPFVARRVREVDVDDVVQDIFLRIQRSLPSLRDDQRFGPWVYQVARSAIGAHARSSARHPLARAEAPEPAELPLPDHDRAIEQGLARYAAQLVSALPSPYREALTLTELEGHSQRAAAKLLGIPLSTMKSRVQRGRARLRAALEACCHIALDARRRVIACEPRAASSPPAGCCG